MLGVIQIGVYLCVALWAMLGLLALARTHCVPTGYAGSIGIGPTQGAWQTTGQLLLGSGSRPQIASHGVDIDSCS